MKSDAAASPHRTGSVRQVAGYACICLILLVLGTTLIEIVAVISFRLTGRLLGSFTAAQMEWQEVGSYLLGAALLFFGSLAGAYFLMPDLPAEEVQGAGHPTSRPPGMGPPRQRLEGEGARRTQEEEWTRVLQANPELKGYVYVLEQRLEEYAVDERAREAEAARKAFWRDLRMLVAGTVMGVVAPVIAAPLLH